MRTRTVLVMVGLCFGLGSWNQASYADNLPVGLDAMWQAGDKAFKEKHYSDAAGWYEKCAGYADFVHQPKDRRAKLHESYGRALVENREFDKAMNELNRALDLEDQDFSERAAASGHAMDANDSSRKAREMANLQTYDALSLACAGRGKYQEAAEWLVKVSNANKLLFPEVTSDGLLECRIGGWYWKAGIRDQADKWLSEGRSLLQRDLDSGKAIAPDTERDMLKNADSALSEIHSKVR